MWVLIKDGVVFDLAERPFEVHRDFWWLEVRDDVTVDHGYTLLEDGRFEPPPTPPEQPVVQSKPTKDDLLKLVVDFCLGRAAKSDLETAYGEVFGAGKAVPVRD